MAAKDKIKNEIKTDFSFAATFDLPYSFSVVAKPNSHETKILGWDECKKELKVAIAAPADKNKANIELLKFIRRISGKTAKIISGKAAKRKIIRLC